MRRLGCWRKVHLFGGVPQRKVISEDNRVELGLALFIQADSESRGTSIERSPWILVRTKTAKVVALVPGMIL